MKYASRGCISNILIGILGQRSSLGCYMCGGYSLSSVSTRRSVPTSFVLTLVPSAVSSVIFSRGEVVFENFSGVPDYGSGRNVDYKWHAISILIERIRTYLDYVVSNF